MAKHPRKRQKTSKSNSQQLVDKASRLNLLLDEESKDDEERRLESMLFGVKYVPAKGKGKEVIVEAIEDGDVALADGGRGLNHLLDDDLFFVDDTFGPDASSPLRDGSEAGSDEEQKEGDLDDTGSESEADSVPSTSQAPESRPAQLKPPRKPPAWTDPADLDSNGSISLLAGPTRLRKLRQAPTEDKISGKEYETRLRRQFETINPEPEWAKKARRTLKVRHDDKSNDGEEEDDLSSSTNAILKSSLGSKKTRKVVILQGELAIERLRDANQAVQGSGSGEVRVVAFHPSQSLSVLCVATADRRVRLFNADGHLSPLLTTLHLPSLPITSPTSALFHPSGQTLLLSGPRPFFYTYDLPSGTSTHHARGLWGTTFSNLNDGTATVHRRRKRGADGDNIGSRGDGEALSMTSFSPHGDLLAVAGRGGYVHLVDWKSGAGQVVGSLKCSGSGGGSGAGGIHGLWWVPASAAGGALGDGVVDGSRGSQPRLAVLTGDAEVYLWDVGERKCLNKWQDEGGFRSAARVMAGTAGGDGGYLAVGSNTGFVNVYGSNSFSNAHDSIIKPKPLKSIANLTTPISTLRFNHDSQLLAMASKDKKDAMRMVHLPSLTAFSNWPTSSTPLGHVTSLDFSPRSEYIAIGNTRGRVLLYHLKDYGVGS